ncbi:hypothetical protein CG747_45275 [Streptomyces sp. CB02959]|uniref:hypothetical protein n=1 Tax=Streptomyces sp. CB02959 TaxID=2020330 RepID=UPI000C27D86F|nr:hypothetical protein [Streptomyces sp. CB02959]PJN30985.1 hypothetical protein CG747_45275 [Streptomyces sp. CB02959]
MRDDTDDVMGLIAQRIEDRFQMPLADLRRAVGAAPQANPEATSVVHWHGLLTEAQGALEKAEDALVGVLSTTPGELDDPAMKLAHQVNAAVAVRDGRAMVVNHLLDPNAPGKRGPGAWRGAEPAARRGPALPTTPPALPHTQGVPVRGATR